MMYNCNDYTNLRALFCYIIALNNILLVVYDVFFKYFSCWSMNSYERSVQLKKNNKSLRVS